MLRLCPYILHVDVSKPPGKKVWDINYINDLKLPITVGCNESKHQPIGVRATCQQNKTLMETSKCSKAQQGPMIHIYTYTYIYTHIYIYI